MSTPLPPVRARDVRRAIAQALADKRMTAGELRSEVLPVLEKTPPVASAPARAAVDEYFSHRRELTRTARQEWARWLESRGYPITGGNYYAPPVRRRTTAAQSISENVTERDRAYERVLARSGIVPQEIYLGIVDTEINIRHPALADRVVAARDLVDGDADPSSDTSSLHGTPSAGLMVAGSPKLKLIVAGFSPAGRDHPVQGVQYAIDSGARIVNTSFAVHPTLVPDLLRIIDANPEVTFVCSAGNEYGPITKEGGNGTLAAAKRPNVAIVAAADGRGAPWNGTSFGKDVTHAAVGANVFSAWHDDEAPCYWYVSGTSHSAPSLANACAKVLSIAPALSPPQLLRVLSVSTDVHPDWQGKVATGGVVNPARAFVLAALIRLIATGETPEKACTLLGIKKADEAQLLDTARGILAPAS